MINKTYVLYINKKEIEVSYKMFLCHAAERISYIQPQSFYNDFLLTYALKDNEKLIQFISNFNEQPLSDKQKGMVRKNLSPVLLKNCRECLFLASALAFSIKTCKKQKDLSHMRLIENRYVICHLLNRMINYIRGFSDAYMSITPLMSIYQQLAYGITNSYLPRLRTKISIELLNLTLKDLGSEVKYKDIKKDIQDHGILKEVDGQLEWTSIQLGRHLFYADGLFMQSLNLDKSLGEIKYVS